METKICHYVWPVEVFVLRVTFFKFWIISDPTGNNSNLENNIKF